MMKKILPTTFAALLAFFSFATFTFGQATAPKSFEHVNIGNFGQMDTNFYRGAQPNPDDYKSLADLGIKTIVDLRNDPTEYEKSAAEAVGIKYINIPMSGWKSPKDEDLNAFLKIANDPATGPMFVHCKAGIHRTGVAGALYRFTKYGWGYDEAYQEMKNYNFSSGLVHGSLKKYVRNYADRFASDKAAPVVAAAAHSN